MTREHKTINVFDVRKPQKIKQFLMLFSFFFVFEIEKTNKIFKIIIEVPHIPITIT